MVRRLALALAVAFAFGAAAQNVPNHSVPIGRGSGVIGWGVGGPCSNGQALVWSGVTADPTCQSIPSTGNQLANTVFAGPSSGAAAPPAFRALVPADLPLGTNAAPGALQCDGVSTTCSGGVVTAVGGGGGGVSSVALALPSSTYTISGSPVTSTGTLTGTYKTQTANNFFAAPDGSGGTPSWRTIVAGDLPLATTGAFGAVKPDGSSITISAGVISASGGGGGTITPATDNGRLTNQSNTPVLTVAVTGATDIYWTPYNGERISLYDGAAWQNIASAEVLIPTTATQTCTTTNTNVTMACTDASQLVVGMKITGTGIGGGATISSIATNAVTMSTPATGSGGNSITFKDPADTGYDVFGQLVSGTTLKLYFIPRSAIFTATALTLQDGVQVLSTDATKRWLGAFVTSATDGQVDWLLTGQRRFRVWNRYNQLYLENTETFTATGTWYKVIGDVAVQARVSAVGGAGGNGGNTTSVSGSGNSGGPGGNGGLSIRNIVPASAGSTETVTISQSSGGTSSFGSWASAVGGATGANGVNTTGANGAANGSNGTASSGDVNITGGGGKGGSGGSGAITDGASSYSGGGGSSGTPAYILAPELVQF